MAKTIPRFIAVLLVLAPTSAVCQGLYGPELTAALDSIARAPVVDERVVGLAVGVVQRQDTLLLRGYGFADLEHRAAVTPETVFRIGSVTKQFTAAAILQLVEQGELSLDDELSKYVPAFPVEGHRVTVGHLLNHTSGIRDYTAQPTYWNESARRRIPHELVLGFVSDDPFEFAPGDDWKYSNTGYYLLGMVIEKVSGKRYGAYLRDHLFEPLGLHHTTYCSQSDIVPNRAEGYYGSHGEFENAPPINMDVAGAAGAICSTVRDMLRWQAALEGGEVVSRSSYGQMTTPATLASGRRLTYGFGLGAGEVEGHPRISHAGGANGFTSYLSRYPQDSLTVVVLVNTQTVVHRVLEQRLARRTLGMSGPLERVVPLSAAERTQYVGIYTGPDGRLNVWEEDGKLTARILGSRFDLLHQGDHRFVTDMGPEISVSFTVRDGMGETATVDWVGRVISLTRERAP